jgi:hypothetical protein
MVWFVIAALSLGVLGLGIRSAQRQGIWSWPMFAFAMGFMTLELLIVLLPLRLGMRIAAWIIAAALFIGFLAVWRRWKPKPR